jgi:hypothetical protein
MSSRSCIVGFVSSVLAIAAAVGCASQGEARLSSEVKPVVIQPASAPDVASIAGVWRGEVWERPTHYLQGVRRITLDIARDGTWTAKSGDTACASGTATIRGGLVFLRSTWSGADFCMPNSLASKDGRMRAVFDTTFKEREGSAMIDLIRVSSPPATTAQISTRP